MFNRNNNFVLRKNQDQFCLFQGCNLKSIKNYDFCYQHVDLFVKNTCQKYTVCKWQKNMKKCNQLVFKTDNDQNEFCFTHSSLAKLTTNQSSNKFVGWKESDKKFNEIDRLLNSKNFENQSDDEDITTNLIDIDSDPELLNFSNDSSDQLMIQILKQHSEAKHSYGQTNDFNSKRLETVGLDLSKKTVYTKDELIKIYKFKLSRLKLLYRRQLNILNDKLVVDRKKYLNLLKTEDKYLNSESLSKLNKKTFSNYRCLRPKELYLKEKYDPRSNHTSSTEIYKIMSKNPENKCIFKSDSGGTNFSCNHTAVPHSKFCQHHIGLDSTQFGFCSCNLVAEVKINGIKPLIRDVIHKCDDDSAKKNQNFAHDCEMIQRIDCIPEHLIEIHNNFLEKAKSNQEFAESDLDENVKIDKKQEYNSLGNLNINNLNSEANTISKETESMVSSSSDSSTSTTSSSDSNMSILSSSSSSSSSSTDSDEESENNIETN